MKNQTVIKIIKRATIAIIVLALIYAFVVSWYGARLLVIKPQAQRMDFCQGNKQYCFPDLLKKYKLTDLETKVELKSFDGTVLKGSYFPSKNGAAIIASHGYGGFRGRMVHIAAMLVEQGFGVIIMDLRAHGESGGEVVTFGRDESKDMQYVFDYLQSRDEVNPNKIGLYGWSLGAATVLLHGNLNHEVKAVVADSAFDAINYDNMQEFTDTNWPLPYLLTLFSSIISGVDFDQEAPIANLEAYKTTPLFLLIPGSDTKVDADSGERLVQAMDEYNLTIWREPTFEHVRFSRNEPLQFSQRVGDFFRENLMPESR